MENRRSSRSIGDLSEIYRYSSDIFQSLRSFRVLHFEQEQRGAIITKSSSIRSRNLRIRLGRLTLMRHDEILRVYSNVNVNRVIPPLPRLPKPRRQLIILPSIPKQKPIKAEPSPSPSSSPSPSPSVESTPSSPALQPMKVTNITIKDEVAIVKMQPTSKRTDYEAEEEEENDDDIEYPEGVTERRPYQIVARYRRAVGESTNFRDQPLLVGDDSTETLVLGLNSFAEEHGCQLTFTDEEHQFDNSIYRAAGGVVDFGSVHLLAADSLRTANFQFVVDLTHEKNMMQSKERIEKFVMDFCAAISRELKCEKNEVHVFSIDQKDKPESETEVNLGLTSSDQTRTEQLALELQALGRSGFASDTILRCVKSAEYKFVWEAALTTLKLQASDLATKYNFDYRMPGLRATSTRGGHPYNLPIGWCRHALRVLDKYEEDPAWIGKMNGEDEWAVAYHGTRLEAAAPIVKEGFSASAAIHDAMKSEAIEQMGEEANRPGLYVATLCQDGAYPQYTTPFSVPVAPDQNEKYCLVFQCRVKPGKFTAHENPVKKGKAWRFVDPSCIRPYGILLKKEA